MAPRASATPEQREQQIRAVRAQLDAATATLRTPQGWAAYLAAAAALPDQDANNVLLIAAQNPKATAVASYGAWQAAGRQVRKGEKALTILGSRVMAAEAAGDEPAPGTELGPIHTDAAGSEVRRAFYPVRVFDLTQTEPTKGAAPRPAPAPHHIGDQVDLYARTMDHLRGQGVAVRRMVVPGCADGLCRKIPPATAPLSPERCWIIEVIVDLRLTDAQAGAAALHQAAHIAAGHLEAGGDYVAHRGRPEVEAGGAAFIVAAMAGLDSATTPTGYDPAWMQAATPADLTGAATTAASTAAALADALALSAHARRDHHAPAA